MCVFCVILIDSSVYIFLEERKLQELEAEGLLSVPPPECSRVVGSGGKRRLRRPISCISVKKFPSCKQS